MAFNDSFNDNEIDYAETFDKNDTAAANEKALDELYDYYYDDDGLPHTDDVLTDLKEWAEQNHNESFFIQFRNFIIAQLAAHSEKISYAGNYGYNNSMQAEEVFKMAVKSGQQLRCERDAEMSNDHNNMP